MESICFLLLTNYIAITIAKILKTNKINKINKHKTKSIILILIPQKYTKIKEKLITLSKM
jgi:hypothetical protein